MEHVMRTGVFDAEAVKDDIVKWIQDFFEANGKGCNAVVGISGGKDSSVVAALCAAALGKERVVGVLMPNGEQADIDVARRLVKHLDIQNLEVNVHDAVEGIKKGIQNSGFHVPLSSQAATNLPPRIRMAALYAVSQCMNGRVANTCNLSEDWVGYATRYGDGAGDFSPLSRLTVTEVKAVGYALGLPKEFIEKTPIDGLCGKTDEENLGFTYAVLDKYISTGVCEDAETKQRIDRLHELNLFKLELMPAYEFAQK